MDYEKAVNLIRKHVPEPEAGHLCAWLTSVVSDRAPVTEPTCPNCSAPGKPFHLRPIPRDFVAIEGATHECSKCGYKRARREI